MDSEGAMRTQLVGTGRGKAARDRDNSSINKLGEKKHTDAKDWYQRHFNDLRSFFDLKQKAISMCMDKVTQFLTAKMNGVNLSGSREAYAAIIMRLVAEELELKISLTEIIRS